MERHAELTNMSRQFSKSFLVSGEVGMLFDSAEKFLVAKGYTVTTSQKPEKIIATRGTKVGSYLSTKIEDLSTTLNVDLLKQANQVHIACSYDIYLPAGFVTTSDKMVLENEVEQMKTNLVTVSKDNGHAPEIPSAPEEVKKPPQAEAAPKPYDYTYELERLAKLRDKGIITDKEFNAKKKQLLGL